MSNYPPNYDQSLGSVPNQQLSSSQGITTNEQPMTKKPLGEWVTGEQSANANKDWLGGSKQPVAPLSTLSMLSGESSLLHQQGQGQGQGQQAGGMLNRIMHPQQQQQQQTMGENSSGAVFHDQRDQFYPPQQQQSEHPYLQPYPQPIQQQQQQQQPLQQQQPFQQQQQPYLQQQQQPYQQPIQQQQPQSRGVLSNILHPHHRSSSTSSTGNTTLAPTTDTTTATTPKKGGLLSSLFGHKRQSSASHSRSTSGSSSTATTSAPFVSVPVEAGMGSGVSDIMSNMFGTDVSRGVVHNEGVLGQPPMLSDRSNLVGQQQQQPLMTGPSMGPSSGLATGVGTGLATGVGTGLISHHLSNNSNNSNVPTSPMVGSTQNVLARISGKLSPFHSLSARDASGQLISFSELVGRPVLIVNVALESRLANQFGGLQALYEKYRNQGFEILAFPCDQFGGSAPGTSLELRDLIMRNFGVTFPIMEKVDVDGLGTHPVFRYLKSQKSNILIEAVKWNFEKFLIDGNGNVIERWNSSAGVEAIEPHIARLLL